MKSSRTVKTTQELLKALEGQQLKQHLVRDAEGRDRFVFEAPIDAIDGAPCLVTEYVYADATSSRIIARQEQQYRWKSAWDANFSFDPDVEYDSDADGLL